jgi:hypothetical protein
MWTTNAGSARANAQAISDRFQWLANAIFKLKQFAGIALPRRSTLSASVRPWTLV